MFAYEFLQQYWWLLIALLGGLLVFLMFVQGANSMIFSVGKTETEQMITVNSTGRKWELTFTTLVTFGGAFFAAFPLFYSTSFGGAFWLWMLILVSFVFQAVSYEFQNKAGNVLGKNMFRLFLVLNGILGPFLVGVAVGTFFTGSDFTVNRNAVSDFIAPVISTWGSDLHGLEAFAEPLNLLFGLLLVFLSRVSGALYLLNNVDDSVLTERIRKRVLTNAIAFVAVLVPVLALLLTKDGFAVSADGTVVMEEYKYFHNFIQMPVVLAVFLLGAVAIVYAIVRTVVCKTYRKGIFWSGAGTVLVVIALFLVAGYNSTAYYPSVADLNSSLTISNSSSSRFTLQVMTYVSFIIPFVVAYIAYAWFQMDKKKITSEEMTESPDKY